MCKGDKSKRKRMCEEKKGQIKNIQKKIKAKRM